MAAAVVNGGTTPPGTADPVSTINVENGENKRKRQDDEQDASGQLSSSRKVQTQRDILDHLRQYESNSKFPGILSHAIAKSADEPTPKKAKLSDAANRTTSISSKLANGLYSNLQDLRVDAEHVSDSLVTSIRDKAKVREGQNAGRLQSDDLEQIRHVRGFETLVENVIRDEKKYDRMYDTKHGVDMVKPKLENGLVNGHTLDAKADPPNKSGTVLTLFGNAPTPKQLFSSLQFTSAGAVEQVAKTELAVEEMSLPTGLAATQILSAPTSDTRKGPTLEDAFPPPNSLPALHPPKSHRRSTTRDTVINWEFKDQLSRPSRKGGYTVQSLTVGDWLGYGGVDSSNEPSSPREKRKMRDRALSSGESSLPPSKATLEESLAKDEEALFKRAYSSFAPSRDNSKAVVPEETKSMVWWQKVGEKQYNETFAIDPALMDEQPAPVVELLPPVKETTPQEDDFSRIVEVFEELEEESPDFQPTRNKTDVDEVLHEISQLLETLASHQRIRNASLASSAVARTPISPAPTLTSRIGRPDSPAEDEMSTYYALRRELAYLVLKLPPYAVAKLKGDQFEDLGISKLITFEGRDVKGTMEEDLVTRQSKFQAMTTAAGLATLNRAGSTTSQHYSSTAQRTPAIGQAANTRYGQSGSFGVSRTPLTQPQFPRSISTQSTYGTPSATAPRPGYGQPNQYSRPPPQPGYGQQNGSYFPRPQAPLSYGSYGQQYGQSTPQPQARPQYASSQPLAQFQQRSQNSTAYQSNAQPQSPFNRSASPLKPMQPAPSPGLQHAAPAQQPGSGRATPSYASQPQTPVNGYPGQRPIAQRAPSGTPQPPPQQAPPMQAQTNGHA